MRAVSWLLILLMVGCAGPSPRKQISAAQQSVYDYMQRTTRLCTGVAPVMSKADCQKRQDLSGRTQAALNVATDAAASCLPDVPCERGQAAWTTAEALLMQMETYIYEGAK